MTASGKSQAYTYGLEGLKISILQPRTAFDREHTVVLDDDPDKLDLYNFPAANSQDAHRYACGLTKLKRMKVVADVIKASFGRS